MNCPFCKKYFDKKDKTVDHIERIHADQLPANMNSEQYLYYSTHGTIKGVCMCGCGRETNWNYKTGKPYKLTSDPSCKSRLREKALENHRRVFNGKDTLLDDPLHQRKMANNRSISGTYKFSDGGEHSYMGSYELNFLKFCDKVLDMDSAMVMDCPYIFEYMDGNIKRFYIPDRYLPDYNLIVEIKEGGKNPNKNPGYIRDTKRKEKLKDKVMMAQKDYNYIKITDNNFGPFLKILFDIKMGNITDKDNKNKFIVINESTEIPVMVNNDISRNLYVIIIKPLGIDFIETITISDTVDLSYMYILLSGKLCTAKLDDKYFIDKEIEVYKYIGDASNSSNLLNELQSYIRSDNRVYDIMDLLSLMAKNNIRINIGSFVINNSDNTNEFIELFKVKNIKKYNDIVNKYLLRR